MRGNLGCKKFRRTHTSQIPSPLSFRFCQLIILTDLTDPFIIFILNFAFIHLIFLLALYPMKLLNYLLHLIYFYFLMVCLEFEHILVFSESKNILVQLLIIFDNIVQLALLGINKQKQLILLFFECFGFLKKLLLALNLTFKFIIFLLQPIFILPCNFLHLQQHIVLIFLIISL